MPERKTWIDLLRGFCMLAILLDHTEIYYTGDNLIDYDFYVVNVLVVFFFLSGYLFYKEKGFQLPSKLVSVARGIVMPYFIFTTLIAVPKALVHARNIPDAFFGIIAGQASWFIAALILAELGFALLLWISRGKTIVLSAASILSFITCILLSDYPELYWQLENACMALPILYLGYLYHRHEKVFHRFNTLSYSSFFLILLIVLKIYEHRNGVNLMIEPVQVNNWLLFVIDSLLSLLFLLTLAKQLPRMRWLEWIGERSIVYYFCAGGVPLLVSKGLQKANMGFSGEYYQVMIAFLLVCAFTTIITWTVYRYVPFITGRKPRRG